MDLTQMSREDKVELLWTILRRKIHGLSFSPYIEGQSPGVEISERQIRERLQIIAPYTKWIRSFSCREGNQETPRIAHENGLKTMVGVGLSESSCAMASKSPVPGMPTSLRSATRSCCAKT